MRTSSNMIRWAWLMVFAGFSTVFVMSRANADPLTQADIEMVMVISKTSDTLRDEELAQVSRGRDGKNESFAGLMVQVQDIAQAADERACLQHQVQLREYRQKLRRIVNVGDLVGLETVRGELQEELQKRQSMSEADLRAEAERQRTSTEEWFQQIKSRRTSEPPKNSKKSKAPDNITRGTQQPALPGDYMDSLEEIVESVRRQTATDEWEETARQVNVHRIKEIRRQIRKIDEQLSAPPMRQAAADKSVVLSLLDPKTLQALHGSLPSPQAGF